MCVWKRVNKLNTNREFKSKTLYLLWTFRFSDVEHPVDNILSSWDVERATDDGRYDTTNEREKQKSAAMRTYSNNWVQSRNRTTTALDGILKVIPKRSRKQWKRTDETPERRCRVNATDVGRTLRNIVRATENTATEVWPYASRVPTCNPNWGRR